MFVFFRMLRFDEPTDDEVAVRRTVILSHLRDLKCWQLLTQLETWQKQSNVDGAVGLGQVTG